VRIAIVGAGAIGGYVGAKLAQAGADVTLVARGNHLAAMRAHGLRVVEAEGGAELVVHPACTDDLAAAVRAADVVLLTVKANGLPAMAPFLAAALPPDAAVVTAQNGIPWWYFERYDGPLAGTRLGTVDPDGLLARSIPATQVIGSVVWPATRLVAPGVIEHVEGIRFTLGELDGAKSPRCQAIAAAFVAAGLRCPISSRIRSDIWLKLLGNVAFNPLSALTRATLVEIATQPETQAVARAMMEEAESVARALGVELAIGVEQRLAGAAKVGEHKTSMLQDLESGRPLELESLVGAVVELGDRLGLELPHLRTVYGCARLLERSLSRAG
jgi:2-dehydropantoate 2-reductase